EKELEEHNKQMEEVHEEKKLIDPVEKIKISKADYEKMYKKYLEDNKADDNRFVRRSFDTNNKNKYEVIEFHQPNVEQTKIYTIEDIELSLLLDKNGNKLKGMLLNNRVNKILENMNKNGSV
ncbi:MAG: hypothetical protein ACRCZO_19245, partial [Cetobacterium sp.]